MMRGHGITTAFADVRSATVAACYLEESAALQLRMLAARRRRRVEAAGLHPRGGRPLRDQMSGNVAKRAWEYFAAVAAEQPPRGQARSRLIDAARVCRR